jgi:hypothetical protein
MHGRPVSGSFADSAFIKAAWISAMPAITSRSERWIFDGIAAAARRELTKSSVRRVVVDGLAELVKGSEKSRTLDGQRHSMRLVGHS